MGLKTSAQIKSLGADTKQLELHDLEKDVLYRMLIDGKVLRKVVYFVERSGIRSFICRVHEESGIDIFELDIFGTAKFIVAEPLELTLKLSWRPNVDH